MHFLPKWLSLVLALGTVFVPLVSAAATLLKVEGSGGVPGFDGPEELRRYLTLHMAEAQPANWHFEPAAAGGTPAPDRVQWRFKLGPYAGGEVRSFVPRQMDDVTFGAHRPITIEARLYLNGKYQTLVKKKAMIQGGPDDPDLAAAVTNLTQNLLSPSGAYRSIHRGRHRGHALRHHDPGRSSVRGYAIGGSSSAQPSATAGN
jgi:hypothetical protein